MAEGTDMAWKNDTILTAPTTARPIEPDQRGSVPDLNRLQARRSHSNVTNARSNLVTH